MQRLNRFALLYDSLIGRGHRRIGPMTTYAFETAMHGAVNIETRWGSLCFAWPRLGGLHRWPAYAYLSPNATPWAATWAIGGEWTAQERRLIAVRRALWGHGYDVTKHDPRLLDAAVSVFDRYDAMDGAW
jgi:hypothetical protein